MQPLPLYNSARPLLQRLTLLAALMLTFCGVSAGATSHNAHRHASDASELSTMKRQLNGWRARTELCQFRHDGGILDRLWIGMHSWNNVPALEAALGSVMSQRGVVRMDAVRPIQQPLSQVVVTVVLEDGGSRSYLSETYKRNATRVMDVVFLPKPSKQMGSAGAKWTLLLWIRQHCDPNDYVLLLDGDDELADPGALQRMQQQLAAHKPWFAWGRHQGNQSDQCSDIHEAKLRTCSSGKGTLCGFRQAKWSYCHPRVFVAALLTHLSREDFKRPNGQWLQKATDREYVYKFLELAGRRERLLFLKGPPIVRYKWSPLNGLVRFSKSVIQGDRSLVMKRKPATPIPQTMHIFIALYDRMSTRKVLTSLEASGVLLRRIVHLCNNNPSRDSELEILAENMSYPPSFKVIAHKANGRVNFAGMRRFMIAKEVYLKEHLEYATFVDDDQYLGTNTLTKVWEARAPGRYAAWYGKNWKPSSDYWSPLPPSIQIIEGSKYADVKKSGLFSPRVKSWQYGGTGCSIIDARVLMDARLYKVPLEDLLVEDLWLSYIVTLNNWNITRIMISDIWTLLSDSNKGQFRDLSRTKSDMFDALRRCKEGLKSLQAPWFREGRTMNGESI